MIKVRIYNGRTTRSDRTTLPISPRLQHTRPSTALRHDRLLLKPLKPFLAAKHPAVPPSPPTTRHHWRPLRLLLLQGGAIRHQLRAALLPLGIFNLLLSPSGTPLPDAEEGEGDERDERGAADGRRDGDLRRVAEGVPLLLDGLRGGGVVVAVEGDGFRSAVWGGGIVSFADRISRIGG
jgi:hypothetical protein